ncbi:MAG: superoxide dismutase [Ni] [Verrucomicrobiota bacterium]
MKLLLSTLALPLAWCLLHPPQASAHCQVPCGIFSDEVEFKKLLEAHTTIAKANREFAKLLEEDGVLAANQATRWILTKEEHCAKIMTSVAEYFLAQRIKPDAENYQEMLLAAHTTMRAAMKAKQDPSEEVAKALQDAILQLYQAYMGKAMELAEH